jgi:microcystin-dependent protein
MMKKLLFVAALAAAALAVAAVPVDAQWQTPNHSVPVGRGAGNIGFGNAAPGTAGLPFVSNGASADPSFQLLLDIIPVGAVLDYTGTTAPNAHFVLAFGQPISRTTYATYFALVGTTYGAGDGSTTFNVPDLRGRASYGVDNMGGSAANRITVAGGNYDGTVLGGTGGLQNHTLVTAELAAHTHSSPTLTDPGHSHTIQGTGSVSSGNSNVVGTENLSAVVNPPTSTNTTGITLSANTGSNGSGTAHTVLSPGISLSKIIRVQHHEDAANDNDEIWYKEIIGE